MAHITDLIPDPDVLLALEPEELGLSLLPVIAEWSRHGLITVNSFINTTLGHPDATSGARPYGSAPREMIAQALHEAWSWLEGQALLIPKRGQIGGPTDFRLLSRRAEQIAAEGNPRRALSARRLAKESLHDAIRDDVWALFHRGRYDTAVFEAMKAVEVAVREAAKFGDDRYGTQMMRDAFGKGGPCGTQTNKRQRRTHCLCCSKEQSAPTRTRTPTEMCRLMILTKPQKSSCSLITSYASSIPAPISSDRAGPLRPSTRTWRHGIDTPLKQPVAPESPRPSGHQPAV